MISNFYNNAAYQDMCNLLTKAVLKKSLSWMIKMASVTIAVCVYATQGLHSGYRHHSAYDFSGTN